MRTEGARGCQKEAKRGDWKGNMKKWGSGRHLRIHPYRMRVDIGHVDVRGGVGAVVEPVATS